MTARTITATLAPLIELLELDQPALVTAGLIREYSMQAGVAWPADLVVRRLRESGWLLDLKTRGVWEFAPAARAGAFGSGDSFIELRAVLVRNVDRPFAVAAESAAYLLGFASRRPDREVIGAPDGERLPKSLSGFRLVQWTPRSPVLRQAGLPVWSAETLLAYMAARPSGFRDWPNAGEWLGQAFAEVSPELLLSELLGRPRSAWSRAAYLADRAGRTELSGQLLSKAPDGEGPYYLGARRRTGTYSKAYDVIDSTGMESDRP